MEKGEIMCFEGLPRARHCTRLNNEGGWGGAGRRGYLAARSAWHIPRDQVRSAFQNTQQASATSRNNAELLGQSNYWLLCVNFVGHLKHSYKW